ncbi:pyrroline-5-carboxylate reductase family protein [Mesorhizobium sp. A623]
MMIVERVGIIGGAGWLGSAIAQSLVASGTVDPAKLTCSYRSTRPARPSDWRWTRDNVELVAGSDIIIVSVQPGDWPSLSFRAPEKLVISVMAGIRMASLRQRTGATRLARALPNAAATVRASYTPIFMHSDMADDSATVCSLFEACGSVDLVTDEGLIDYFTGMTGSGPAFPALLAEAMIADALDRGIPSEVARRAAVQTLIGAARIFETQDATPAETVKAFVDYGGTTAAAISKMRELGFGPAVRAGLEAAYLKARSLSRD